MPRASAAPIHRRCHARCCCCSGAGDCASKACTTPPRDFCQKTAPSFRRRRFSDASRAWRAAPIYAITCRLDDYFADAIFSAHFAQKLPAIAPRFHGRILAARRRDAMLLARCSMQEPALGADARMAPTFSWPAMPRFRRGAASHSRYFEVTAGLGDIGRCHFAMITKPTPPRQDAARGMTFIARQQRRQ